MANSFEAGALLKITVREVRAPVSRRIFLYDLKRCLKSFDDSTLFVFISEGDGDTFELLCSDGYVGTLYTQYYSIKEMSES